MWLLGILAVFVSMVVVYGITKDVLGLPMPWPALAAALVALAWVVWPTKKGER